MEQVAAETGVSYVADNETCAKKSSCLVLAVKPQQFLYGHRGKSGMQ